MTSYSFTQHTIVLLVGPSNSGKTTFATSLNNYVSNAGYKSVIISSDNLRRTLLCDPNVHKYDKNMMSVSSQAFDLLEAQVKAHTTYPVNTDVVIVDSTALSNEFRDEIRKIADQNKYNVDVVVFDLPRSCYTDMGPITRKHYLRLKEEMKNLSAKKYNQRVLVKDRSEYVFKINPTKTVKLSGPTAIIGDIHECYNELRELLGKLGVVIDNDKIVSTPYNLLCIGDYIDKGPFPFETVDFLFNNRDKFTFVQGNHENFVIGYWDGKWDINEEVRPYFSSAQITNAEYRHKVLTLYSLAYNFVTGDNWIATHAPCRNFELGKSFTEKQQRNYRHTDKTDLWNDLQFLHDNSNFNHPYHIFGHIAFDQVFKSRNKIGIDTGCSVGGKLSCVIMDDKPKIVSVDSTQPKMDKLLCVPTKTCTVNDLDSKQLWRYNRLVSDGVRFISGTMAPADRYNNDLESIDWAMQYYAKFTDRVCLQVKQMGSRANIYLYNDPDKCFTVSRSGFKVKLDLTHEYQRLIKRFSDDFNNGLVLRIIDAELMPWSALGAGLIKEQYVPYLVLSQLNNQEIPLNWDMPPVSNKDDYIKEHGYHNYNTALGLQELKKWIPNKHDMDVCLEKFEKSLRNYVSENTPWFEPFSILLDEFIDGTFFSYENCDNSVTYNKVNDNTCWDVSVNDVEQARSILSNVGALGYEGVVVKPKTVYIKGCAPYIKVRQPEYLRLTYGPDYTMQAKYDKLLQRKRVGRKLQKSIAEFELGMRMLNGDQSAMMEFIMKDVEQGIDPRL